MSLRKTLFSQFSEDVAASSSSRLLLFSMCCLPGSNHVAIVYGFTALTAPGGRFDFFFPVALANLSFSHSFFSFRILPASPLAASDVFCSPLFFQIITMVDWKQVFLLLILYNVSYFSTFCPHAVF